MGGGRRSRHSSHGSGERQPTVLAVEAYAPFEPGDHYADLGGRPPMESAPIASTYRGDGRLDDRSVASPLPGA